MFTLKLYSEGRTRIVAGESFTIYRYSDYAYQISVHPALAAAFEGPFYVGSADGCSDAIADAHWYDKAIIENAAGKTTEILQPAPTPLGTGSNSRGRHSSAGMSAVGVS